MVWGIDQRDYPILTPGQGSPFGNAFQSGLEAYRNINKAAYEPLKTKAEVASKMAYANLMEPQYLAKLMGNQDILANIPDSQKKDMLDFLLRPKSANTQGGSLLDSLVDLYHGKVRADIPTSTVSSAASTTSPVSTDNTIATPEEVQQIADFRNGQKPKNDQIEQAVQAWIKSPEASAQAKKEGMMTIPSAEELLPWYQRQLSQQPQRTVPLVPGITVAPAANKTFAENVAEYKGIVKEGESRGDIRAKDLDALDTTYYNGKTNEVTLNDISNILADPEFEQIRQLPLAQQHELAFYAKEGTPEQQRLIGRYYTLTGNIIKDSARDFAGQFRQGEQILLQGMKPNPSDTIETAKGKVESLAYLNGMLTQRSKITADLIKKYHMNKGQATELADQQVNGKLIRQQVKDRLNPSITIINKKTGERKTVPIGEARKLGVPNV